jgi:precorrin-2/cobalt-factor-2 C20-methyltransferase
MITTHPIRFVSLGPGEPDLITLKGLKALQGADCIFCPATMTQDGKSSSRALSILNTLGFSDTVQCFRLPMDKDRTLALRSYEAVYESSKILRAEGQNVVIVAEGDAGLYSSIHYIYDKLQQDDIPVEQIAGIPAFIASGAMAGLHIVSQEAADRDTGSRHRQRTGRLPETSDGSGHNEAIAMYRRGTPMYN